MSSLPLPVLRLKYEKAAQAYLSSLPPEHFMESTPQATQREITVESLALVKAKRPDIQYFNDLLVQYPLPGGKVGQVVPDNMVVVWKKPIVAEGSYLLPAQPARPFWMLEYVSKYTARKDYEDNFRKYEQELKVPYYLWFVPDAHEMTLFRRGRSKYVSVKPNGNGRHSIKELELEVGLLEGWVRFWFRGELLPLPAELQGKLEEANRALEAERQARIAAEEEVARLRAELERLRRGPGKKP